MPITAITATPILACPSWCDRAGHHEFAQHVAGPFTGCHVRAHMRELLSVPTVAGTWSAALIVWDLLSVDDQGVIADRTPARIEVYAPGETTRLDVDEVEGLAVELAAAARTARQLTGRPADTQIGEVGR